MEYLESIILGVVQGLTEFLPISSSGHLEISKAILGNDLSNKESLLFTIVLHFATALSTLFFFRKDILNIILGLFDSNNKESKNFSISILISMIPAVFVGLFFEDFINSFFDGNLILVGCMLYITAILLYLSDVIKLKTNEVTFKNSFIIGLSQAIAILPGISRSGSTISSAILLGIDREKAARFSFLMVLPLIFGSMTKTALDLKTIPENINQSSLLLGFIFAFISGILACTWMISMVKKSQLKYFGFYCVIIGGLTIFYGLF